MLYARSGPSGAAAARLPLGGTTSLTLLVEYGLICFLRHHLSNTANRIRCIVHHF